MADRAPAIPVNELSKAVERAVSAAMQKHGVQFAPEFRLGPGTIIGRQLLQADMDIKKAEQIATEITQHITQGTSATLSKSRLQPAVLITPGGVTCGMIPPEPEWEFK